MRRVFQQTDAEEAVGVEVEGLNECGLYGFHVEGFVFDGERECLTGVYLLHRLALSVQTDAGEQGGVGCNGSFNGCREFCLVQAAIEQKEVRKVVMGLSGVLDARHVDAILHGGKRCGRHVSEFER
jgi:hypothetical protein